MVEEKKDLIVDWLELPDHLLQLIANRIISLKDYVCFGAVCKLWFSTIFIHDIQQRKRGPLVPVLMLSTDDDDEDEDKQTCSYYNLTEKKIYHSRLLMPHNRIVYNSSRGWLVTLRKSFVASLLNPFMSSSIKNHEIDLPSLKTLKTDDDRSLGSHPLDLLKVALSANPIWDSFQCMVMAIYGLYNRVAYCKLGECSWTPIDLLYDGIHDVMYYRNQFYFVHMRGSLFSYDPNDPHPKVSKVAARPKFLWNDDYFCYCNIVESNGNLLLAARTKKYPTDDDDDCNLTRHFYVFKLDLVELVWIEVKTLDGHTLFLGRNCSVSLSASDFSECRPNCIYYTNEHHDAFVDHIETFYGEPHKHGHKPEPHDMGVFNLEDGSFLQSYYPEEIHKLIPRPIWIEPTLLSY